MIKLFTIYDSKAGFYQSPFNARSKGEALRMFQQAANDPKTSIGLYPEDFVLYELGSFNDLTGQLESNSAPVSLGKAMDYVNPKLKEI